MKSTVKTKALYNLMYSMEGVRTIHFFLWVCKENQEKISTYSFVFVLFDGESLLQQENGGERLC